MNVDLTTEDLDLIVMLLDKEEGETRVEIHHAKNHDYRDYLKEREKHLRDLLGRLRQAEPKATKE